MVNFRDELGSIVEPVADKASNHKAFKGVGERDGESIEQGFRDKSGCRSSAP